LNLGDTFINRNTGSPEHLWVVCSPPRANGAVLMFNLTSLADALDDTCIIGVGEHPFVRHDSAIEYERGRLFTPYAFQVLQAQSAMDVDHPASLALVRKIQLGALASSYTARKFKAIIEACILPDQNSAT
jgi:hypothetical protein